MSAPPLYELGTPIRHEYDGALKELKCSTQRFKTQQKEITAVQETAVIFDMISNNFVQENTAEQQEDRQATYGLTA